MDIVLINGVNFSEDNTEPQLGLIALKKVLNETFNVDIINFDTLYNQKNSLIRMMSMRTFKKWLNIYVG